MYPQVAFLRVRQERCATGAERSFSAMRWGSSRWELETYEGAATSQD